MSIQTKLRIIPSDKSQFEQFYRSECQSLYRYVCAWVGCHEHTLQIVQESFLDLHQSQSGNGSPAYTHAPLFRAARSKIAELIGGRHFCAATPGATPGRLALAKLDAEDREWLALRLSGLDYRAMAEVMGGDPSHVARAILSALRRFEDAYTDVKGAEGRG